MLARRIETASERKYIEQGLQVHGMHSLIHTHSRTHARSLISLIPLIPLMPLMLRSSVCVCYKPQNQFA